MPGAVGLAGLVPAIPLDSIKICKVGKEKKKDSLPLLIQFGKCRLVLADITSGLKLVSIRLDQ